MRVKHPPKIVRHDWKFTKELHQPLALGGVSTLKNVYVCKCCGSWTVNLPLYKYEVCEKKDRRKNKEDRRKEE